MSKDNKTNRHDHRPHKVTAKRSGQTTILSDAEEMFDKKSGSVQKQYPRKIGYHGTDKETTLNPEE